MNSSYTLVSVIFLSGIVSCVPENQAPQTATLSAEEIPQLGTISSETLDEATNDIILKSDIVTSPDEQTIDQLVDTVTLDDDTGSIVFTQSHRTISTVDNTVVETTNQALSITGSEWSNVDDKKIVRNTTENQFNSEDGSFVTRTRRCEVDLSTQTERCTASFGALATGSLPTGDVDTTTRPLTQSEVDVANYILKQKSFQEDTSVGLLKSEDFLNAFQQFVIHENISFDYVDGLILRYQSNDYVPINNATRNQANGNRFTGTNCGDLNDEQCNIWFDYNLSNALVVNLAILANPKSSTPITLWRGVQQVNLDFIRAPNSLVSASLDMNVAANFAGPEGTVFKYELPVGYPGFYMNNLELSIYPHEQEILLPYLLIDDEGNLVSPSYEITGTETASRINPYDGTPENITVTVVRPKLNFTLATTFDTLEQTYNRVLCNSTEITNEYFSDEICGKTTPFFNR